VSRHEKFLVPTTLELLINLSSTSVPRVLLFLTCCTSNVEGCFALGTMQRPSCFLSDILVPRGASHIKLDNEKGVRNDVFQLVS
jgi:hypothetical protein